MTPTKPTPPDIVILREGQTFVGERKKMGVLASILILWGLWAMWHTIQWLIYYKD